MATCTTFLDNARCTLPADHAGPHVVGFEGEMPEDVTQIVATVMTEADAAIARAEMAYRSYRRSYWFMLIAAGVNILAVLWSVAGWIVG